MNDELDKYSYPSETKSSNLPYWILGIGCLGLFCLMGMIISVAALLYVQAEESGENPLKPILELGESVSPDAQSDSGGGRNAGSRSTALPVVYEERFQSEGNWDVGTAVADDDPDVVEAEGVVSDGVYAFTVFVPQIMFWANGGESLGDGLYTLDATAVAGPEDNGFGMIFLANPRTDDFYVFEISSDGFVWIGSCTDGCAEVEPLVEDGWFSHSAVNQGLGELNRLAVSVDDNNFVFYVNDIEVAQFYNSDEFGGDIGLFVETFDEGDVTVHFDNFTYSP